MNTKPSADMATVTVKGRTLQEAKDNVRRKYGVDALIVATGMRQVPRKNGLGELKTVEMTVALPKKKIARPVNMEKHSLLELSNSLETEVERIEAVLASLRERGANLVTEPPKPEYLDYPLARALLSNGASVPAVRHLANLYRAEGGQGTSPGQHLQDIFRTSGGRIRELSGCHVFLGGSGAGKTSLLMSLARDLGRVRKVLLLTLYPHDESEVDRLRTAAAKAGYDAAVLRDGAHLVSAMQLVDGYDLVLVDTPSLQSPAMNEAGLQQRIVLENRMHRHLVVAMDQDLQDAEPLWRQARNWNCDWLALSRIDLLNRPGKLLDLLISSPVSVSLRSGGLAHNRSVDIVTSEWLAGMTCRGGVTVATDGSTGRSAAK